MINVTTTKYTHSDVLRVNVSSAISRGSAHTCRRMAVPVRLLNTSLRYERMSRLMAPRTVEGMLRRFAWVVLKPSLRRESVR